MELWWLLSRLAPDYNTIADFRKDYRKALKKVLGLFVRLCREMGLVKGEKQCVDGTPFNGLKQSTSIELSRKKLAYAREQLALAEAYLRDMDEADAIDQGRLNRAFALDIDPKNLPTPKTSARESQSTGLRLRRCRKAVKRSFYTRTPRHESW